MVFIDSAFFVIMVNLLLLPVIKGKETNVPLKNLRFMKNVLVLLFIVMMTTTVAMAQSHKYQRGYVRKSTGTYVTGHYKTRSDRTNHNNFSTRGRSNPYTGSKGYRARDYSSRAFNYGRGKTIRTGSRGGQYYSNRRGNRTYVPKR